MSPGPRASLIDFKFAMPLLGSGEYREPRSIHERNSEAKDPKLSPRNQSQHSTIAKTAIMSHFSTPTTDGTKTPEEIEVSKEKEEDKEDKLSGTHAPGANLAAPQNGAKHDVVSGSALTDTPLTTASNSPVMWVKLLLKFAWLQIDWG